MKYLIYLRVSTDKQDVEMQNRSVFNYLKSKHPDDKFSYEVFSDPDTSSRLPMSKRKALQEMLGRVRKNDVVLVYKLDRLSRDVLEMVSIYREITRNREATVHSLNDPYCDDFSVGLMGVLAEKERADISTKTKDAIKNKKERGERYSRFLPYGYGLHERHMVPIRVGDQVIMKPGVLVPIDAEQRALALMSELFDEGKSYQSIASTLNNLGYRNREGKPFQKMSIYRILLRTGRTRSSDQPLEELESLVPR